ncbi:MAG: peptide deformylase [Candidatus Dojkabacteria bacterium]|nr:peptide deformylase [Candidatus Dojkabacteria bacterium]
MKTILQLGDPLLEKKAKPVREPKSKEVQTIVHDLIALCKEKEENSGGLAAPQIGIGLQIFVARRLDLEEEYRKKGRKIREELDDNLWEVFVNPRIAKRGKRTSTFWEGCLSVDDGQLFGPVTRPATVQVKYTDKDGNKKLITASEYFAHVVQHELDHLKGILFVKYIDNPENLWRNNDLDKYIREHGDFPEAI